LKGEFSQYGNQKNRNEISSKARYEVSVQNCSEEINQDGRQKNGPKKGSEENCREEGREESAGQEDSYQEITTLRPLSAFT
jgi:hypothetical protein